MLKEKHPVIKQPHPITKERFARITERLLFRLLTTEDRLLERIPELRPALTCYGFHDDHDHFHLRSHDFHRGVAHPLQVIALHKIVHDIRDEMNYFIDSTEEIAQLRGFLSLGNYAPDPVLAEDKLRAPGSVFAFNAVTAAVLRDIELELERYLPKEGPHGD